MCGVHTLHRDTLALCLWVQADSSSRNQDSDTWLMSSFEDDTQEGVRAVSTLAP